MFMSKKRSNYIRQFYPCNYGLSRSYFIAVNNGHFTIYERIVR